MHTLLKNINFIKHFAILIDYYMCELLIEAYLLHHMSLIKYLLQLANIGQCQEVDFTIPFFLNTW